MDPDSVAVVPHPLWNARVTLTRLSSAKELNGAEGVVVFFSAPRLRVLLTSSLPPHVDFPAFPRVVLVKPENVAPLPRVPPVRAPPPARRCASCGAAAPHACGRCRSAYYCGAVCQHASWAAHKFPCRASVELSIARLHPAAAEGNVAGVLAALDAGAAINAPSPSLEDFTALHLAVSGDHAAVVAALVARGAHLDARSRVGAAGGSTPLMETAPRAATNCARALVEAGADVRLQNRNAWTALHFAASEGNLELVRLLLDHGAEPNAVNNEGDSVRFVFEMRCLGPPRPFDAMVRAMLHSRGAVCLGDGELRNELLSRVAEGGGAGGDIEKDHTPRKK